MLQIQKLEFLQHEPEYLGAGANSWVGALAGGAGEEATGTVGVIAGAGGGAVAGALATEAGAAMTSLVVGAKKVLLQLQGVTTKMAPLTNF